MSNRNSQAHFELAPQVAIERSTFDRSTNVKTSFNVSDLVPFFLDEVLPGDTFEITTSKVARLQTLITPIMDNIYIDTYYFFVPNRLVWEHWQEFCGENKTGSWYPDVTYSVPQLKIPIEDGHGFLSGTIADYFGVPVNVPSNSEWDITINALPFRAYALICNEWFRDENLSDPLLIPLGDETHLGTNTGGIDGPAFGGLPFKVAKYHDYFSSCLPSPQRGPDVQFLSGLLPVNTYDAVVPDSSIGLKWRNTSGSVPSGNHNMFIIGNRSYISNAAGSEGGSTIRPDNLFADLSKAKVAEDIFNGANPLTINSLRQAFQIQRMFEKDARSGTRYIEILKGHFGVTSPDARLQRPEYLGGNRIPLNVEQVVQQSSTDEISPMGTVAGWSHTTDVSYDVQKSFVEHGFIIGLMCARYEHSYQQGLERMWSRKNRFDYYWPALAHLGEKAVYDREIFLDYITDSNNSVFGYQEAWAEYRYKPNYITGEMRSTAVKNPEEGVYTNPTLDVWHFGDKYTVCPSLSDSWIREDKSNVDRTLAVQSSIADQIFVDIFVKNKVTRPMPLYSIPGLIDHF